MITHKVSLAGRIFFSRFLFLLSGFMNNFPFDVDDKVAHFVIGVAQFGHTMKTG
jgi:hypothetical protein